MVRSEDDADDELLSVAVLKGGAKVAAGSGTGALAIFSWGHWEDCSDRFPGAQPCAASNPHVKVFVHKALEKLYFPYGFTSICRRSLKNVFEDTLLA